MDSPDLASTFDDKEKHAVRLPDWFPLSKFEGERLEFRMTEVSHPGRSGNFDLDEVEFQFSASPKHCNVTVRTETITLGEITRMWSEEPVEEAKDCPSTEETPN
jgi:hypothetical protein